ERLGVALLGRGSEELDGALRVVRAQVLDAGLQHGLVREAALGCILQQALEGLGGTRVVAERGQREALAARARVLLLRGGDLAIGLERGFRVAAYQRLGQEQTDLVRARRILLALEVLTSAAPGLLRVALLEAAPHE